MLGLGAQKAGTTWLHTQLEGSPQFARGYFKEYHVFDCIDVPIQRWNRDKVFRRAAEESTLALAGERAQARMLHRASMVLNPQHYFDHFSALLSRNDPARLAADVTPDYALLPARRLSKIRDHFAERGIRTAVVFLMRDPVERTYSQIRMQQGRQPRRFPAPAEAMVERIHDQEIYASRSRYETTIAAVDSVFDPADVYYGFYEELFEGNTFREICGFLGIDPVDADFGDIRNVSQPKDDGGLPESAVRAAAQHLAPTYRAVAERFPDRDLARMWPSSRFVL